MHIINIGQLVTSKGFGPSSGKAMGELEVLNDAFISIEDGKIAAVGTMDSLAGGGLIKSFDAEGAVVIPGLVDPHTHAVFKGTREDEFLARCMGEPYGKGILTSMNMVREASEDDLYAHSRKHVEEIIAQGTTTLEIKSGYGLSPEAEIKQLKVARRLADDLPIEIVTTFLGAHAVPQEFSNAEYIDIILNEMLPQVAEQKLAEYGDIFCEVGFFTVDESRKVLSAFKDAGLKLKIHAEEMGNSGSAEMAAELGATSADHLLYVSDKGMSAMKSSGTIPVLMPGTAFTLNLDYAPARKMIEADLPVALGTDFNPGTCLINSMFTTITLAVMRMRMSIEEALTAATLNAAAAIDRAEMTGSIEAGKRADLVFLDLGNYKQIPYFLGHRYVKSVMAAGEFVT